jgi:hypothetical protein
MLVLMVISSDCGRSGYCLQLDQELQSSSHQLAHVPYKQILSGMGSVSVASAARIRARASGTLNSRRAGG